MPKLITKQEIQKPRFSLKRVPEVILVLLGFAGGVWFTQTQLDSPTADIQTTHPALHEETTDADFAPSFAEADNVSSQQPVSNPDNPAPGQPTPKPVSILSEQTVSQPRRVSFFIHPPVTEITGKPVQSGHTGAVKAALQQFAGESPSLVKPTASANDIPDNTSTEINPPVPPTNKTVRRQQADTKASSDKKRQQAPTSRTPSHTTNFRQKQRGLTAKSAKTNNIEKDFRILEESLGIPLQ